MELLECQELVWNTSTVNLEILNFIKRAEQQLTIGTYLILTTSPFICGKLCCVLWVCAKSSGKPWTSDLTVWWVFAVSFSLRSEIAKTTRNHKMQMTGRFHMEIQICGKNPRNEDGVTLTAIFPASWNFDFFKVFIYYSALFLQHTVLNCKNKMTWNLLKI